MGVTVRSQLFVSGDAIRGRGRLVRTSEGDWFDPPVPVPTIGYRPGYEPAPAPSSHAIRVVGADLDDVLHRFEHDGAVEGIATVHGTWLGDGIEIHRQTHEPPALPVRRWRIPPCPAPDGGWPVLAHPQDSGVSLDDVPAAVSMGVFRPTDEQPVLVVAAADVDAVRAHLEPRLGGSLCVVPSRWTMAQLDETQHHLVSMLGRGGIYGCGRTSDEQGQAVITAEMLRVTDEFAEWCDRVPAGLVRAEPCLTPAPATPLSRHSQQQTSPR